MPKTIHEILDSLKNEENAETIEEALKAADALHGSNKQLYNRAKKAEGYEYDKVKKDWIKKEEPVKKEVHTEKPKTSNEPDYAKLAYLKGEGVTHPDDQRIIQDEAERLKLPLTDVLQMEHIKSKLSDNKAQREADAGTPNTKGRPGASSQGDVEYWIDRKNEDGSYQNPDDIELYEKVSNARIAREEKAGMFEPIR